MAWSSTTELAWSLYLGWMDNELVYFLCLRAYLPRSNLLNGDYLLPTPQRLF
jgi:hypothetical protein